MKNRARIQSETATKRCHEKLVARYDGHPLRGWPSISEKCTKRSARRTKNTATQYTALLKRIGWINGARSKSVRNGIALAVSTALPTMSAARVASMKLLTATP